MQVLALLTLTSFLSPQDPLDLERLGKAIETGVARIAGRSFEHSVRIKRTNGEQFTKYAIEKMDEDGGLERAAKDEEIAKLLGILPREVDLRKLTLEVLAEQVGGFYDPPTDTFYVVEGLSEDLTRVVMAHEFTHALDDQHFDLDGLDEAREGSSDAQLALHALAEGSAMEVMERWMVANLASLDMAAVQESQASFSSEALQSAPAYVWKPLLASYMAGQNFLRKVERRTLLTKPAPIADLDRAWQAPPLSMEQVLHPEKYWDPKRRDDPTSVTVGKALVPQGWKVLRRDVLGELLLGIMVTPPAERRGIEIDPMKLLAMSYTHPAAAGWDGDEVLLVEGPDGEHALLQLSVWDTEQDAAEFVAGVGAALGKEALASVQRAGRAVGLVRGNTSALGLSLEQLRAAVSALDSSLNGE